MKIGEMGNIGAPRRPQTPPQSVALKELLDHGQQMLQTSLHQQAGNVDVAPAVWTQAEENLREKMEEFIRCCRPSVPSSVGLVGPEELEDEHSADPTDESESPSVR